MRIFYVTTGQHIAGGQLVNLDHVATLRRMGYDARFLIVRDPKEPPDAFTPSFPPGLEAPWQRGLAGIGPDDVVAVGEMFGAGALAVLECPARRVLHNQGPFYSFQAFRDLGAIRHWGCESMILCSGFAAEMLAKMGWDRPSYVVRPVLDPIFAEADTSARKLSIAATTTKRPYEWRLLRGMFKSLRPDLDHVQWDPIEGVPRAEVARRMAASEIFLAMGQREGLGLPPLEAMATGALVVGFYGGGGREYATPENGDWFGDDDHFAFVEALAARVDALIAGERFEDRRAAGRATAASFGREAFEAQLAAAWGAIVGPPG